MPTASPAKKMETTTLNVGTMVYNRLQEFCSQEEILGLVMDGRAEALAAAAAAGWPFLIRRDGSRLDVIIFQK